MKKFNLKIITPEKVIYDQQVHEVILPTKDGQAGILAEHAPYMAPLNADELVIFEEESRDPEHIISMAIDFGLAEFSDNQLTILVGEAEPAAEIDLALAEQAKKRAQELMKEQIDDEDEYAHALALLEHEIAKIKVANKYRHQANH